MPHGGQSNGLSRREDIAAAAPIRLPFRARWRASSGERLQGMATLAMLEGTLSLPEESTLSTM